MSHRKIDPERLAALMEGRVSEPERSEMLEALARSPDDLAVFADAAAIVRDADPDVRPLVPPREQAGDATSPEVRGRGGRGGRRWRSGPGGWLAIAAVVAGIATLGVWNRSDSSRPRGLPPDMAIATWGASRGAAESRSPAPSSDSARAWRVGVRLADAQLAIEGRQATRAAEFARDLALLLQDPRFGLSSAYFTRIADSASVEPGRLDALFRAGRASLSAQLDASVVELGEWAELARAAAIQRHPAFFRTASSRSAIRQLSAWRAAGARESAAAIAARDWRAAADALAAVIESSGR